MNALIISILISCLPMILPTEIKPCNPDHKITETLTRIESNLDAIIQDLDTLNR